MFAAACMGCVLSCSGKIWLKSSLLLSLLVFTPKDSMMVRMHHGKRYKSVAYCRREKWVKQENWWNSRRWSFLFRFSLLLWCAYQRKGHSLMISYHLSCFFFLIFTHFLLIKQEYIPKKLHKWSLLNYNPDRQKLLIMKDRMTTAESSLTPVHWWANPSPRGHVAWVKTSSLWRFILNIDTMIHIRLWSHMCFKTWDQARLSLVWLFLFAW